LDLGDVCVNKHEVLRAETLAKALVNMNIGLSMHEGYDVAVDILTYFGYGEWCSANNMDKGTLALFYMLEDAGIMKSETEEVSIAGGKDWRIVRWHLLYLEINKFAITPIVSDTHDIYAELPEETWVKSTGDAIR